MGAKTVASQAATQPIVAGEEKLVNAKQGKFSSFAPRSVWGVDFSGAARAGQNAWIAELQVTAPSHVTTKSTRPLKLIALQSLGQAAGDCAREVVYRYLIDRILASDSSIWGMDFPFGLPIELGLGDWPAQLRHVTQYKEDAPSYGRHLVSIAQSLGDVMHIRRLTDRETKTPFDCYHYRIIYQTFHGMRDVLRPLSDDDHTLTLPFQSSQLTKLGQSPELPNSIRRVVLEACPSSTLKNWNAPHRNYKQSGGKVPTPVHQKTRQQILRPLCELVDISSYRRRQIMQNPGGNALDAVLAGVGVWQAWHRDDHHVIAANERYPLEGRVYC